MVKYSQLIEAYHFLVHCHMRNFQKICRCLFYIFLMVSAAALSHEFYLKTFFTPFLLDTSPSNGSTILFYMSTPSAEEAYFIRLHWKLPNVFQEEMMQKSNFKNNIHKPTI